MITVKVLKLKMGLEIFLHNLIKNDNINLINYKKSKYVFNNLKLSYDYNNFSNLNNKLISQNFNISLNVQH